MGRFSWGASRIRPSASSLCISSTDTFFSLRIITLLHTICVLSQFLTGAGAAAVVSTTGVGGGVVRGSDKNFSNVEVEGNLDTIVLEPSTFHHQHRQRERPLMSDFVKSHQTRQKAAQRVYALEDGKREGSTGKQQQQKQHHVSSRKLSPFDLGCQSNPSMCLALPGWTADSKSSTCCDTGFCVDIMFDGFNCGGCGEACSFGFFCCSGKCVSLSSDRANCGTCGNSCGGQPCIYGFCNY